MFDTPSPGVYEGGMSEQTTVESAPESTDKHYTGDGQEVLTDEELGGLIERHEALNGLKYEDDEPQAEEPVASESTDSETPPASESADEPAEASQPDTELDDARRALERIPGLSKGAIDKMAREDALALAAPIREQRSQLDEIHRQLAELRKGSEKPEQIGAEDSESLGAPADDEHPSPTASTLSEGIQALSDEFGPDAAKAFEAILNPLASRLEQAEKLVGSVMSESRASVAERVMDELGGGGYPALQRAEARGRLFDLAERRVSEGQSANLADAIRAEARLLYGEAEPAPDPNESAREQGVVSPGSFGREIPHRQLSDEERQDQAIYDWMDRHSL